MHDVPVWRVGYANGELLEELAPAGETPFRAIDWPRVVTLILESEEWVALFDVLPVEPPATYRLMRRRVTSALHGELGIMLLVTETPTAVQSVLYWLPDNTSHTCTDLDCASVRHYATTLLAGTPGFLSETHSS